MKIGGGDSIKRAFDNLSKEEKELFIKNLTSPSNANQSDSSDEEEGEVEIRKGKENLKNQNSTLAAAKQQHKKAEVAPRSSSSSSASSSSSSSSSSAGGAPKAQVVPQKKTPTIQEILSELKLEAFPNVREIVQLLALKEKTEGEIKKLDEIRDALLQKEPNKNCDKDISAIHDEKEEEVKKAGASKAAARPPKTNEKKREVVKFLTVCTSYSVESSPTTCFFYSSCKILFY